MPRDVRRSLAKQAGRARERFLGCLKGEQARVTQGRLLAECVAQNGETVFGREHRFSSCRTLEDYRRTVPIRRYEELAPWIDRSAAGEEKVLTSSEPIRFWKTTGTTSLPKRIPVTPESSSRTMECFLTLQGTQLHYYPELNERVDTTLVTHISPKSIKEYLGPRSVPYCSTTELPLSIRPGRESLVAPWLPGLQAVVEDDAERLYYLLCFAARHDLLCLACLHPSRLRTVVATLNERAHELIQELRRGTVLGTPVGDPEPDRAERLRQRLETRGRLSPRDLWPGLRLLCSWSGRYIERYRQLMEEEFCSGFLPMPSVSSEAFTNQTVDRDPYSQPLNLRGGVFEFVPAEEEVRPDSPTLQFFELEEGRTYEVILTTLGGLYRYATCDFFRVGGFLDLVPRLEYVGRRSVTDLTGEKLAEEQVAEVVPGTLSEFRLERSEFALCAVQTEESSHYVLVLEGDSPPESLASALDQALRAVNSRYELKRNFEDLSCLAVRSVPVGTFSRFRRMRAQGGAPAGQLKETVLYGTDSPVLAELTRLGGMGGDSCN